MGRGYRSLKVWQRSTVIAARILKVTATFSRTHQFGIGSQMQRAAVSIPSNIAEGASRTSKKEYAQFLSIALGSTAELETQCNIAVMAGIIAKPEMAFIVSELDEIGKMLRVLRQSLKS